MRSRAILLVLLAGGVVIGGASARVDSAESLRAPVPSSHVRLIAPGPPALAVVVRANEQLDRESESRQPVDLGGGGALALVLALAWWIAWYHHRRRHSWITRTDARPRAPPALSSLVCLS